MRIQNLGWGRQVLIDLGRASWSAFGCFAEQNFTHAGIRAYTPVMHFARGSGCERERERRRVTMRE